MVYVLPVRNVVMVVARHRQTRVPAVLKQINPAIAQVVKNAVLALANHRPVLVPAVLQILIVLPVKNAAMEPVSLLQMHVPIVQ